MQSALYFPFINVPPTAWWTRSLLYWDRVGTIVPYAYREDPEKLGEFTLSLIREEMLQQFVPEDAGWRLRENFDAFLRRLGNDEIDHRRQRLRQGHIAFVHRDKWLSNMLGLRTIQWMGLARDGEGDRGWGWIEVEQTTANEFMAALALALCEEVGRVGGRFQDNARLSGTWVPTTDRVEALEVLLAGLESSTPGRSDPRIGMRIRGEIRAVEVRTQLLEGLLPVPRGPLPIARIAAFRKRHGDLLPKLRRHLESKVDEALAIDDEVLRFRLLDRIRDELEDQIVQAETYLRELSLEAVSRSSLLRIFKFIPLVKDLVEAGQDLAQNAITHPHFRAEPLAYLAFARTAFSPAQRLQGNSTGEVPFLSAMSGVR